MAFVDRLGQGATGRIDRSLVQATARGLADPVYYVSGTPGMVVGTLQVLTGLGTPEADIEIEAFRGYA